MKRSRADVEIGGVNRFNDGQRSVWVVERSKAWWEMMNSPECTDLEFKDAFRMRKSTFASICEELEPHLTKKRTVLRKPIPVQQRVGVCIWRLATGETIRQVSTRFGLGVSTCHHLVMEVCNAINNVLMPKYLHWPDRAEMEHIKLKFENISKIPNVVGVVYNTHVQICKPLGECDPYVNLRLTERTNKNCYSVTIQGVVDHNGIYTDICIGYPGSMSDEEVLKSSTLFNKAKNGTLSDGSIVGNSNYSLMDWLMVPYTRGSTVEQMMYNYNIDEINRIGKAAFMRLKARWRCLSMRNDMKAQELNIMIGACCVLHNVCESFSEEIDTHEIQVDSFDDNVEREGMISSDDAVKVRDSIANKMMNE